MLVAAAAVGSRSKGRRAYFIGEEVQAIAGIFKGFCCPVCM